MKPVLALALIAVAAAAQPPKPETTDVILKAMQDELARSNQLRVIDLDVPYYIEYSIEDAELVNISASLGGLLQNNRNRFRMPQVQVRIGTYEFDNTNHIGSGFYSGARYDPDQWPLDDNYAVLRHYLWLATDRHYKMALEGIARKRATLKNIADPEKLPDFSKVPPTRAILPVTRVRLDQAGWAARVVKLSEIFSDYPEIWNSGVEFDAFQGIAYFANSEGSVERISEALMQLRIRAQTQTPDGMIVRDSTVMPAIDANTMPPEAELRRAVTQVAGNLRELLKAPVGESYSGPVLFEPEASAQLFAQLLGDNLRLTRRPVSDPGRPVPQSPSELESKIGSRILPEWIDVVDDATQKEWRGRPLKGFYLFDMEGVAPKPVVAVEKGVLKNFLMTRQPMKNISGSTGHARLNGGFGARSATISNLFIKASKTRPMAELKQQLIEQIKQRNKPYGILVRKLDYPSSLSPRELQTTVAAMMQAGGGSRPVSPPILVYRVYPDGREELVRGLRFRGLTTRSLRDIMAASEEMAAFDFVNNGAPFALMGAGGIVAATSVISPALLFEEIELERPVEELSKPPLVPAPTLETARK